MIDSTISKNPSLIRVRLKAIDLNNVFTQHLKKIFDAGFLCKIGATRSFFFLNYQPHSWKRQSKNFTLERYITSQKRKKKWK